MGTVTPGAFVGGEHPNSPDNKHRIGIAIRTSHNEYSDGSSQDFVEVAWLPTELVPVESVYPLAAPVPSKVPNTGPTVVAEASTSQEAVAVAAEPLVPAAVVAVAPVAAPPVPVVDPATGQASPVVPPPLPGYTS
jgi:hypothetical protein